MLTSLGQDLNKVRESYINASKDKAAAELFIQEMSAITKKDSKELIAYKGASMTLTAKYAGKIEEKKAAFKEGVSWIEFAITQESQSIELRFIRMSVQENSPKIVGYKSAIPEDKAFILAHIDAVESTSLRKTIQGYILQSAQFSEAEKQAFRNRP
jgi:hypothetical protein